MRRVWALLLAALMCLAPLALLPLVTASPAAMAERTVDAATGATPNYRTFLRRDIKSMPETGGNYTCLKAQAPFTYFTQEWYGVKLSYLLDVEVGMKADTTAVKIIAQDGYSVTLTLEEIRDANPKGLNTLLAWKRGPVDARGGPYEELDDEEGPFRLILPQATVGPHNVGTPNWNKAVMMVRAIEVQPTPPGLPSVEPEKTSPGQVVVYGNVLNRRTFTVDQIKSLKNVTARYPWKNTFGTKSSSECTGVPLDFFIDEVAGTLSGATGITAVGEDGYTSAFTLDQVRQTYPGGLKMLLAWNVNGELKPSPDGDGPLMVIKPQADANEINKSSWAKWVRVIRVDPMDVETAPDPGSVPDDRIIVCGSSDPYNVPSTWYLAEGYTGGGFEEWICIGNPNSWETRVDITYMIEGESGKSQRIDVPPLSRYTVNVNETVGSDKNVSAKVVGYHGDSIVAERAMYWGGRGGGHCAPGVTGAAKTWYLAEGSTQPGFETWILVQNPGDQEASVSLTYMTETEEVPGPTYKMPPSSRKTFSVADSVPGTFSVSTKVTSDTPVIAERAMYWGGKAGGHCASGVRDPGSEWYLAEGSTAGGFETWILIQNPGDSAANVSLTYMNAAGQQNGPAFEMTAHSRKTVKVADTLPGDWQVSTRVASDAPVIAERAMYWGGGRGGHCESGTDSPKFRSFLAEGATDGGFESWILVQNPGSVDATVYITYLTGEGAVERAPLSVPAGKRVSTNVAEDVGANYQVSAQVCSTAAVAVERAVYWSGRVEGSCSKGYLTW